jgi:hypothetical protein
MFNPDRSVGHDSAGKIHYNDVQGSISVFGTVGSRSRGTEIERQNEKTDYISHPVLQVCGSLD